jgi:hypothetical protein
MQNNGSSWGRTMALFKENGNGSFHGKEQFTHTGAVWKQSAQMGSHWRVPEKAFTTQARFNLNRSAPLRE